MGTSPGPGTEMELTTPFIFLVLSLLLAFFDL